MFHYRDQTRDSFGNGLSGYQIEAYSGSSVAPIYADAAGTPLANNRAISDGQGNFDFYIAEGVFDLRYYDASGILRRIEVDITVANSTPGEKGDPGGNVMSIGTFAQVRSAGNGPNPTIISSGTDIVMTSAHTVPGYGRAFYRRRNDLTDAHLAQFPLTTFKALNLLEGTFSRWMLVEDDWHYEQFGAVPYVGTPGPANDCSPAYSEMQALNQFQQNVGSVGYIPGREIRVGIGKFYHTQPHNSHARHTFIGQGGGTAGGALCTQLVFAADTYGVIVNRHNTNIDQVSAAFTQGAADGLTYRAIGIVSLGGTDRTKHGWWARARFTLEDVSIIGFPGNNFHMVANSSTDSLLGTNLTAGNANDWQIDRLVLQGSGRHAFYAAGIDVNGGASKGLEVLTSGCGGIMDLNFLQNSHTGYAVHLTGTSGLGGTTRNGRRYLLISATEGIGVTVEPGTNDFVWYDIGPGAAGPGFPQWDPAGTYIASGGILTTNPNSRTTYQGGYVEVGQVGVCHVAGPSMVTGGALQTEFTEYTPYEFMPLGVGAFRSNNGGYGSFRRTNRSDLATENFGSYAYAAFGEEMISNPAVCTFMRVGHVGGTDFRAKLLPKGAGVTFDFANLGSVITFLGNGATNTYGRSSPIVRATASGTNGVYTIVAPNGLVLRQDGNGRKIGQNAGVPATGQDYAAGEFWLDTNISTNRCLGWSCFTSATLTTPGTGTVQTEATWLKSGALFLDAVTTYDPPSLAPGSCGPEVVATVSPSYAPAALVLGDKVSVAYQGDSKGIVFHGRVTANNAVTFFANNPSGNPNGTVDLPSSQLKIRVEKM